MIMTIISQIKEWIPYVLTGIVSCGGTSLALSFLKTKITNAKDNMDNAKKVLEDNTNLSSKQIKELTDSANKTLDKANEIIDKFDSAVSDMKATKEALKIIATNNPKLVGEGIATEVVEVLSNENKD